MSGPVRSIPAAAGGSAADEDPDPEVERRFERHLDLADRLARRYSHGGIVDDDLRQVARLGLLLASRRFDPELGHFVRFASVTIIGELKKHLRSHGWAVRVPRALQEDSITVAAASERLTSSLGRAPSVGEVADHVGFERERVADAVRVREARFGSPGDHLEQTVLGTDDPAASAMLSTALSHLTEDERALIEYRFRDGLTQAEIGERIGISQPQVHRRLAAVVDRLRDELHEHQGAP
ncbi:sigma-70 family RNA polymerase sigma factor [Ilumatobacter sp.]|uniref:sigma-70 family RNA polymerase sigma factor n=1 Tax=Ilumatobacter sp. TaxID=1967498 RepID=UPI003B51A14E